MDNIDDMMGDFEERERGPASNRPQRSEEIAVLNDEQGSEVSGLGSGQVQRKVFVGAVEHFYDKLNVMAITLTGSVKVGDTIEIEEGNEIVKLKVSSMQIDRVNVEEAGDGDDVGIETDIKVNRGSKVYVLK